MKKRIDLLLVERKYINSRSKAQAIVMAGQVYVENKKVLKSGETFILDSKIEIKRLNPEWVSRGAYKILHAINFFNIKIKNLICLDIGASTGGFTQVLLKHNAKKIYSVDVGTNQLHEKLLKEKKIINIEKTNARYLNKITIPDIIDLIVCDASFINLKKVLESSLSLLNKSGEIIALIKPQFEAKKNEISKGGIVKDPKIHKRICDEIAICFKEEYKLNVKGIIESPIKGPKGNIEFLIYAKY